MQLLAPPVSLSDKVRYLTQGIVLGEPDPLPAEQRNEALWEQVAEVLHNWAADPDGVEDEGVVAPDEATIRLALDVGETMQQMRLEPPGAVMPNGDGGLVFRWRSGDDMWTVEFDDDGTIESSLARKERLVCRHTLHEGRDL